MTTTTTVHATPKPPKSRRTLTGNGVVLAGAVLYLCEFVGIAITGPHSMPAHPGATSEVLLTTYAGQTGAVGFLVGWFGLVLPGRVLLVLGVRQALSRSGYRSTALDQSVVVMTLSVAFEVVGYALNAASARAADQGDTNLVAVTNQVGWSLMGALYATIGASLALMAWAMWQSRAYPRVLAGLLVLVGTVDLLNGALLSAPSHAALQDQLSGVNLLMFALILWLGVLTLRRRRQPTTTEAEHGAPVSGH